MDATRINSNNTYLFTGCKEYWLKPVRQRYSGMTRCIVGS